MLPKKIEDVLAKLERSRAEEIQKERRRCQI